MKQVLTTLKFLTVIALGVFAVSCASSHRETQNLAVSAGFQAITPRTAEQQTILAGLPAGQVTPLNYKGDTYFVLPDAANNQAFVGGPEQYQAYQQLRLAQHLSNQNLQAAQMNQRWAQTNWNSWNNWRGMGGWGWRR